jgi:Na+/H+ antiporter NhaA
LSGAGPPRPEGDPATGARGRRSWTRRSESALAIFARTETAGALALLAAAAAALVWANLDAGSYGRVWQTRLAVELGGSGVAMSVGQWINSGLMAFFFFVVGLEARREMDIGELRERRRTILPLLAGVGGMIVSVALYLAVNAGRPTAHGWGVAMSTDTAFALGVLALVGTQFTERLRVFVLTVMVVDDLVALVVIATVYSRNVRLEPVLVAAGVFAAIVVLLRRGLRWGWVYFVMAVPAWVALSKSGIDPLVIGLAMGLVIYAIPPARQDLERATDLFRGFREQPTPELARAARVGLQAAVSPNERLEQLFHPWTSFLIVPLFALSNTGIVISGSFLVRAFHSPVTLGIVIGYVVGKPVGITCVAWVVTRASGGRLRPPVGWLSVTGAGTLAGIGFTVSLLVASLAFGGQTLQQAKLGILAAAVGSALLSGLLFRTANLLPPGRRARALLGTSGVIEDLAVAVDPDRDHVRGPATAPVTLVEYGDFECPYCGQAEPAVRALLAEHGDLRYVWRHLPLVDVHPRAMIAALASEAAAAQGAFWPMHDLLLDHQTDLRPADLIGYAEQLGLDRDRFGDDLHRRIGADHVAEDLDGADLSNVTGTPSFFINGRRHRGAYDRTTLTEAVRLAKAQASIAATSMAPVPAGPGPTVAET